jgi:mannosyltransferase OCH1-like enzyme
MLVHYIWVGNKEIPSRYIKNYEKCIKINPGVAFKIWKNDECLTILEDNNLLFGDKEYEQAKKSFLYEPDSKN